MPLGSTDASSAIYDLFTTAWMIKKSYKFIGVESGGTHFALTIKDPKDILFYDKTVYASYKSVYAKYRECHIKNGVTAVND